MTKTIENTALETVSPSDPKSGSDAFVFLPAGSARKDGLTFEPGDEALAEAGSVNIQMSELSGGAMLSFADTATAEPQPILFPVDGAKVPAEVLASLLALPMSDAVLETEAGTPLASGGGSVYQDDMGDPAAGLLAQGVIDGRELAASTSTGDQDNPASADLPSGGQAADGQSTDGEPDDGDNLLLGQGADAPDGTDGTDDTDEASSRESSPSAPEGDTGGDTGGTGPAGDTGGTGGQGGGNTGDTGSAGGEPGDTGGTGGQGGGNPGQGGGNNATSGGGNGHGNEGADAGAGNGGEDDGGEIADRDPGNSGANNNSPAAPPGQSQGGDLQTLASDDLGITIRGFDADEDILDISDLLSDLEIADEDRAASVDILFERGHDASVVIDTTGDGNFDTLGVTLDNYRGDLGLDDLQLVDAIAA